MKKINVNEMLFAMGLILAVMSSNIVFSHEVENDSRDDSHKGIFMGLNIGGGHSAFGYTDGTRTIIDEGKSGGLGGLRFGYSFSNSFALSLEGFGFGQEDDCKGADELGLGAGFLAATWHPGGHGFFLRTGLGSGGGEFVGLQSDERIKLKDRAAFLFSIGYDWRLNDSLTLGLSVDSMVIDAGNTIGPEDDYLGASGLTVQFNWYL